MIAKLRLPNTPTVTWSWLTPRRAEAALLAVPLVVINLLAGFGQSLWAYDHLTRGVTQPWLRVLIAVGFSIAVETVALFLAAIAHQSRMAGDASLPARLASYAVAAGAGTANYDHWAKAWTPCSAAVTFGLFSCASPWLWGYWSKAKHRAKLRETGLIDPRSVRFSLARWILYPASTFWAFRRAVWLGVTDPSQAILLEAATMAPAAEVVASPPAPDAMETTPAPAQAADVVETEPEPAATPQPRKRVPRRPAPSKRDAALAALAEHPDKSNVEIARLIGSDARTVSRARPPRLVPASRAASR